MSWCKSPSVAWGHPGWPRITQLSTWQHHRHIRAERSRFNLAGKAAGQGATLAQPWRFQGTPRSHHPSLLHSTQHGHMRCHPQQSLPAAEAHQPGISSVPFVWQGSWLVIHTFLQPQSKKAVLVSASHWGVLLEESQHEACYFNYSLSFWLTGLFEQEKKRKKREKEERNVLLTRSLIFPTLPL